MFGIKRILLTVFLILSFAFSVTAEEEEKTEAQIFLEEEMTKPGGDSGRLIIPDLSISVGLNDITGGSAQYGQEVTDNEDSAAWCDNQAYYGQPCRIAIADHNYQGFGKLSAAVPGKTMAYIKKNGELSPYLITAKYTAFNLRNLLQTTDGTDILETDTDTIVLYTCKVGWEVIEVAEMQPYKSQAQNPKTA